MQNQSMFEETQANTISCLNQIVVANHNRQQEMKKWMEQAILSGKMETVLAKAEGIPFESLSTVAKYCLTCKSREEIEHKIFSEALRISFSDNAPIQVNTDIVFIENESTSEQTPEPTSEPTYESFSEPTSEPTKQSPKSTPKSTTKKPSRVTRSPILVTYFEVDGVEFSMTAKQSLKKERQHKAQIQKQAEVMQR